MENGLSWLTKLMLGRFNWNRIISSISGKPRSTWLRLLVLTLLMVGIYGLLSQPNPHLEHIIQAASWLRGHFYIDPEYAPGLHEKVLYQGHWYEVHPPLNAIIMLLIPFPIVASVVIGVATVVMVDLLFSNLWLTAFFAFGTNFSYGVANGDPWNFSLILGCCFTVAALLALKHHAPLLMGLFNGAAFLARYDYLFVCIPFVVMLLDSRRRWRSTLSMPMSASGDGGISPSGSGSNTTRLPLAWTLTSAHSMFITYRSISTRRSF